MRTIEPALFLLDDATTQREWAPLTDHAFTRPYADWSAVWRPAEGILHQATQRSGGRTRRTTSAPFTNTQAALALCAATVEAIVAQYAGTPGIFAGTSPAIVARGTTDTGLLDPQDVARFAATSAIHKGRPT